MSMLPPEFSALGPFVDRWALAGEAARADARSQSKVDDRQAFYDVAQPLLAQAMHHLDSKPFAQWNDADLTLMRMMMSLCHVALAVEVLASHEPFHAVTRNRLVLVRHSHM